MPKLKRYWKYLLIIFIAIALLLTYTLGKTFIDKNKPIEIKGLSMNPSFIEGQFWLTENYEVGQPQRGDAITYQIEGKTKIGRVIALPNEKIKISDGEVYINGQMLDESLYKSDNIKTHAEKYLSEDQEITLPENSYFIMGDNRSYSEDSRAYGPIGRDYIKKITKCYKNCQE